jgi:hypothetical protein
MSTVATGFLPFSGRHKGRPKAARGLHTQAAWHGLARAQC